MVGNKPVAAVVMSKLSEFIAAIEARLRATPEFEIMPADGFAILVENPAVIEAAIERAVAELGLVILIGQPTWRNGTPDQRVGNMDLTLEIAIGENPTLSRAEWKLTCLDVAQLVTTRLQGFKIRGFNSLSVSNGVPVSDKKRAIYQVDVGSKWIVPPTGGTV